MIKQFKLRLLKLLIAQLVQKHQLSTLFRIIWEEQVNTFYEDNWFTHYSILNDELNNVAELYDPRNPRNKS